VVQHLSSAKGGIGVAEEFSGVTGDRCCAAAETGYCARFVFCVEYKIIQEEGELIWLEKGRIAERVSSNA
jgi:hypothetical protein